MSDPRFPLELGEKYRLLALLGEGGTARVWLAMARSPGGFNKLVVLKTIRSELFDNDHVVEMFLEEAKLAARLSHPNIVQTNEIVKNGRQPVIVMEYLDGLPFSAVLERQRAGSALALAMLLRVISEGLAGLHSAHELRDYDGTDLRVVHRDVSPHNLFVTFAGEVKVLDFGIAQLITSREATETGVIKGKLRYIAPEQVSAEFRVDRRADVYSMGVILWEVAAARRMWAGMTDAKIMQRILAGELPTIRQTAPDVDPALARIVDCALQRDPDRRFPSALAFQNELDRYISTLGAALRDQDLGRAVSKMFDDVRQERRQTIEHQLARIGALPDLVSVGGVPELTSFSNTRIMGARGRRRRKSPVLLVLSAIGAMALFFLALFSSPEAKENAYRDARKKPPAPKTAQISATSDHVRVHITAFPRDAQLTLDGRALPSNPHTRTYQRDKSTVHRVEVSADGYQSQTHSLTFGQDQEVVVNLIRSASPKSVTTSPSRPRPGPRRAPVSAPPPAPEVTEPVPQCSPPYYYDERGVKKYRPECL